MAEYNVDEYTVEGENTQYNFKISLVDNKINLQLTDISESGVGKNYEGEFTLDELRQINRVFHLTNTIYDAQVEFKKAVEITGGKFYENSTESVSSIISDIEQTSKSLLKDNIEIKRTDIPEIPFIILFITILILIITSKKVVK